MAMLCVYGTGECSGCMFCRNFDDDTDTDVPFSDLPDEEDALEYIDED